ncbi:transient receptor potential cation channel subfamily M member 3-like [Pomacea canaliculata]|uniref:transient receptor potential cation channel subfamily M member 3-like n=1 Tax=Pomacea canaliculata TaxID=400727 RepID=UPI000D728058|nr:transient receptor potential cation channel subfamily M member 3-like [Pomacea canaliculata]XP_025082779.1 transient receptor potential cation channel subfamily M member 3-like [Pomacea canaliculata]
MSRTGKVSPSSMEQNGTPRVCCGYIRERTQARNGQQANEEDKKQTLTTVVFRLPKSASAAKAHPTAAVTWQSVPNSLCGDCKQETNPENSSTAEEVLDLESLQVWKEQSTENKAETSDKQDKQTKVGSKKGPSKRSQESRGTAAQQDTTGHSRIQQDTKAKDGGGQGTQLKDDKPSPEQATTDKSHGKFETHEKNGSSKQPGCIRCLLTESPTSQTSTTPTSRGRKQPLLILYLLGEAKNFCDGNRRRRKAFERNFMSCLLDTNTWIFANSGFKDYLVSVREKNSFRDDKNVFFFYTDPAKGNNETLFSELRQFSKKKEAELVFVFLNGERETFEATVPVALERSIPVIVIKGSGNFADIVSQKKQSKKQQDTRVDTRGKNQKAQSNMKDISLKHDKKQSRAKKQHERISVPDTPTLKVITKSQSPTTKVNKENERMDRITADENLTVFDLVNNLGSKSALRLCILEAIIKKDDNSKHAGEQNMNDKHLKLAFACESTEKAEEMKGSQLEEATLTRLMKEALQGGKDQFVSIFLDCGVELKTFLNRETLDVLCKEKTTELYQELSKKNGAEVMLEDILQHLLDDICMKMRTEDQKYKMAPGKVKQTSSKESTPRVKDPELALFLWALLSGKFGLAQFLWREVQDHVTSALVACILLRAMRSRTMNNTKFEDEQQEILENIEIFEGLAIKALNNCYRQDEIKTFTLLSRIQQTGYWRNVTCLEIAERARCRKFIAQEPCQTFADRIWRGLDPFSKASELQVDHRVIFTRIFYAICAIFVVVPKVFMEFSKNKRGPSQLLYAFRHFCFNWPRHWEDPSFKFYSGWFFFIGFLILYAYVMMVRIPPEDVQIPELALLVWFITLYIEELRVCWMLSKSKRKEKRVFVLSQLGFLNVTNFYLAMIGIVLWIIDSKLLALHFVICLNFISFVFRLFYYLAINSQLGPKVFMIYQMIKEIIIFSVILMIIFIAYGVVKYSLENRGHGVVNSAVVLSLPVEAFWLMLADRPDDKDDSNQDPVVVFRGLLRVVYLMFTGVLLVNLLIAAFSYLFEVIHSQKEDVRKYQKYQMIVQFYLGSPFPPPLSLFYYIITYLYRFIHCSYRTHDDKSYKENKFRKSLNEKETRSLLNWARVTTESYNDDKPKTIEERVEETMKKNFELHDDNNDDSLKKLVDAAQGLIDESHKLHESLQCSTDALRDALEELAGMRTICKPCVIYKRCVVCGKLPRYPGALSWRLQSPPTHTKLLRRQRLMSI